MKRAQGSHVCTLQQHNKERASGGRQRATAPWGESKTLGRGDQVHPPGPAGDSNGDQIVQSRVKVVLSEIWDILPIRVYVSFVFGEFVFGEV
ncbi:hypothetical protein E2C01_041334 [Portunus trituberculatus]|uniref:Uncharacterized protein n=1 Tax=Portunus trituberculatus TaxID=210409 RepID=A0A5B7FRG2_PORTR|nr:hypothetical protein [Portunus trituberculatus]